MSQTQTSASDGGGSEYFWLGGSDIDIEGDWRWSDQTKIDASQITPYDLWGKGPGFNTEYGEPDNFMGNQDCLAMGKVLAQESRRHKLSGQTWRME